ncbi:uncharacterized protein J8A68_005512 [[Candida] subhashii]|uniref:Uncharacterized protein n=1 Tax=[Candida] subhashii TaxID=561895 RepID=A0A8J5UHQ9_9ASCO|nr:uncharacterized protein J8A68_005512 [[Candida] subhashii]KAG7660992.1 hypothetical protein J8A68_005512 [[Candida] subhashii]
MSQDIEEYKALTSTLSSFYNFHKYQTEQIIKPRLLKQQALTPQEAQLVPWYTKHIENLKECIILNTNFLETLAISVANAWSVPSDPQSWEPATERDYDVVATTLLQLMREWSDEGQKEREVCYGKILDELESIYPDKLQRQNIKILNPGTPNPSNNNLNQVSPKT